MSSKTTKVESVGISSEDLVADYTASIHMSNHPTWLCFVMTFKTINVQELIASKFTGSD